MSQITPLPNPPSTSDPANFATEADTFIAALPGLVTEINAFGDAINTLSTTTASTTSVAIGTGTKNFTVDTGKSLFVGMSYKMAYDANNWMLGDIISYDSGTGALSIDVDTVRGSGTYAAWVGTLSFNGQIETPQYQDNSVTGVKLNGAVVAPINDFRLTLTTGVPVTTSDVTGATTIYCCPYKGNRIALYDGSRWNLRTSAEFSLALGTLTSGRPYDVFCYDNAGVPTLEFNAWTNDTTRATALTYQDGILVKSGALTRRYLGTFYTTATTTTEDSKANRYLWNYYNRVVGFMERLESTDSWVYTAATIRQANNSTSNQLNYVCGVAEDAVEAEIATSASNTALAAVAVGVGVDSTTDFSGTYPLQAVVVANANIAVRASYKGIPGAGRHYLAWLEYSQATGTTTWRGDNGTPTIVQSGIIGSVWK